MIGRSLEFRFTALQQGMAFLVVVLFAASALALTATTLKRQESARLARAVQRVARAIDIEFEEEGDLQRSARVALLQETNSNVHFVIRDPAGRVLATSNRLVDMPVDRDSARSHAGLEVMGELSRRPRAITLSTLARSLLVAAIPLLLLSWIASRWMARRALRPLAALGEAARTTSVEAGVRALGEPSGLRELDDLKSAFDRLLVRLDDVLRAERRFTSDASHELRTPLTVLSGELELALTNPSLAPDVRSGLVRAFDQVVAMRELVEALLLLRRTHGTDLRDRAGFEPVNLSDVAGEVARTVQQRHPSRSQDLDLQAPDEVLVEGHPVLLTSAVRNLVENAVKFTANGERVRIHVDGAEGATLSVDDGGRGISIAERERVFDAFYRGAEARAGSSGFGLGLPILRLVARAHGGDVAVDDSPLGGARFTLRLPPWRARGERTAAAGERSDGAS